MINSLQSTLTCNRLKIPKAKLQSHAARPAIDFQHVHSNLCENQSKKFCRDWCLTLNTSKIQKLSGFRLKTIPSIVLRLWAALLTDQAHHPALQPGSEGREWLKACVGRNKLHSSGFTSPLITKKGKEIFSGDSNLHLRTVNYLLYFGSPAKHLTFKCTHAPRELKRQFRPDVHKPQTEHRSFLTPWGLFSTVTLTAALRNTEPYVRRGPALLQRTLTHPEGTSKAAARKNKFGLQQIVSQPSKNLQDRRYVAFQFVTIQITPTFHMCSPIRHETW